MSPTVIAPKTRVVTVEEAQRIVKDHALRHGYNKVACLATARDQGLHTAEGCLQLDGTRYYLRTPGSRA